MNKALVGLSMATLLLVGGLAAAQNGDGTKNIPTGGRGYGFVDANGDGINDNFVDANNDGIDDAWVDADGDGIHDERGTKAGLGAGRIAQNSRDAGTASGMGTGRNSQTGGRSGQGRGGRK